MSKGTHCSQRCCCKHEPKQNAYVSFERFLQSLPYFTQRWSQMFSRVGCTPHLQTQSTALCLGLPLHVCLRRFVCWLYRHVHFWCAHDRGAAKPGHHSFSPLLDRRMRLAIWAGGVSVRLRLSVWMGPLGCDLLGLLVHLCLACACVPGSGRDQSRYLGGWQCLAASVL